MNLIIDIGNTFFKCAVYNGNQLLFNTKGEEGLLEEVKSICSEYTIKKSIISSVQPKNNELYQWLDEQTTCIELSHDLKLPFNSKYTTPNTLGKDRIAAVVGAIQHHPEQNRLVIDMGTCITYDLVTKDNMYHGGAISPGYNMRFKALHEFTGKLPLVLPKNVKIQLIGDSTENSILSGVFHGIQSEVNGIIQNYIEQYSDLIVVVTGGNVNLFDLAPSLIPPPKN